MIRRKNPQKAAQQWLEFGLTSAGPAGGAPARPSGEPEQTRPPLLARGQTPMETFDVDQAIWSDQQLAGDLRPGWLIRHVAQQLVTTMERTAIAIWRPIGPDDHCPFVGDDLQTVHCEWLHVDR